jgi:hypothetical protein
MARAGYEELLDWSDMRTWNDVTALDGIRPRLPAEAEKALFIDGALYLAPVIAQGETGIGPYSQAS